MEGENIIRTLYREWGERREWISWSSESGEKWEEGCGRPGNLRFQFNKYSLCSSFVEGTVRYKRNTGHHPGPKRRRRTPRRQKVNL